MREMRDMMISMSAWAYTVCDVFTDAPLAGNPLAVFTDAADIPDAALGRLAREMNLSETVFVYPPQHGADARLRIFTLRRNCRLRAIRCLEPRRSWGWLATSTRSGSRPASGFSR